MNDELYGKEVWEEIKQVASSLFYPDEFRAEKSRIEPYYRGLASLVAIAAACASFTDSSALIKAMSILTALTVLWPVLFTAFLPVSEDFSKIDGLRICLKNRLVELERFWYAGYSEETYEVYLKAKEAFAGTETEVSALFGKTGTRIEKRAVSRSEKYLQRFTVS
jgi:hypothetical protein